MPTASHARITRSTPPVNGYGSSLSALNRFGVYKTTAHEVNCQDGSMLGGLTGYLDIRPSSECIIAADDVLPANPFLACLAASQRGGAVVEPPTNPWADRCELINCPEGEQCTPQPEPDDPEEGQDLPPPDPSCADGDDACELTSLGQNNLDDAVDSLGKVFSDDRCPGCLQPGWEEGFRNVINNPPPVDVNPVANLNPGGVGDNPVLGRTRVNNEGDGLTVEYDDHAMRQVAYDRAAIDYGLPDATSCAADSLCATAAIRDYYPAIKGEVVAHEYGHVAMLAALASGSVFDEGAIGEGGYLQIFNYDWEAIFGPGACDEDVVTCSAQHEWIKDFLGRISGGRNRSCGVEGACSDSCGFDGLREYEACSDLAEQIRQQYRDRMQPDCPPPHPFANIEEECRFQGCFGSGIDTSQQACWFAQCTGTRVLSTDVACSCCNECSESPPAGGGTGASPSCAGPDPECERCCRFCSVPEPAQICPQPIAPTAPLELPGWYRPIID